MSLIAELPGHTAASWGLSWNPASPILASCSTDKSIRFHSFTPSLQFAHSSTIPTAHTRTIRSVSFSPTGNTLASASFDSTVGIWTQNNEEGMGGEWEGLDPLEGHESECKSIQWSFDGRLIASCSRDKSVWVWEVVGEGEFECLAVLMEHSQDVKSVTWHPSEELLASASYDDTIKLYAADPHDDEWTCIATLTDHTATVWTISFSPCGNYLASAGDDLTIHIWGRDPVSSEAATSNGTNSFGGIRVGAGEKWKWSLKTKILGLHERTIYSIDWKAGGAADGLGRIVTAGGDGVINIIQIIKPIENSTEPTYQVIKSIESAHGVSDVNHVAWCTLSPARAAKTIRALEGGETEDAEEDSIEVDSRWEGTENLFASAGDDGIVKVWKV